MSLEETPARRTSARGLRRRQLLLEASGELRLEHGFYFTSLDDLLEGSVRQLADGWLAGAGVADPTGQMDDPARWPKPWSASPELGPAGETAPDSRTLLSLYTATWRRLVTRGCVP